MKRDVVWSASSWTFTNPRARNPLAVCVILAQDTHGKGEAVGMPRARVSKGGPDHSFIAIRNPVFSFPKRGGHWGVLNTAIPQKKKNDKYRIIAKKKKIAKYRHTAGRPKPCQKSMK